MEDHAFLPQIPALLRWDQIGRVTSSALPQEASESSPSQHRMESGPFFLDQLAGADERLYSENPTNGTGNCALGNLDLLPALPEKMSFRLLCKMVFNKLY